LTRKVYGTAKGLQYLEDESWSKLVDSRWEKGVKAMIKGFFLNMTEEERWYILKVVAFQLKRIYRFFE